MKIFKVTVIVISVVFITLLLVLSRYGLFASVSVSEKVVGPYLLIYKKHIGDYKNVGTVINELCSDLKNNYSLAPTKGFGLYYDDPRQVDKAQLRSIVGCVVEGKTREELSKVSSKYGVREYPSSNSVVAEFPYKGMISIFIGIMKVYPALGAYIKEHRYNQTPIMELYDMQNERIEYISSMNLPKEIFDEFLKSKE
ncbi:MAG: GyrI-like domain-containing protein [Gammaproteobacteria bacterium]|nr:GyrI-like domain-containing protein [Gammaproteobacteria bacterium]